MEVRFWGVRGSIAVSGDSYARTGGNTSCVELCAEGERLIIDAGTGLRALGEEIGFSPVKATILLSHVHWDHIQGVPFFAPAYHPGSDITFVGATRDSGSVRDALDAQMTPPTFPVGLDTFASKLHFKEVICGKAWNTGPFKVTPVDLHHPDGVFAYRVEVGGQSVVYATDVEHLNGLDERLVRLAEGADLLIHDAQYTTEEYLGLGGPSRRGWGHATWHDAVEVAAQAGAAQLALFHHDPIRRDEAVAQIETNARERFSATTAAREGVCVAL